MKVISYNILRGGQFEAGNRLGQILNFLKSENPDLVCLYECDYFHDSRNGVLDHLEAELEMRGIFHPTPSGTNLVVLHKDHLKLKQASGFDRFMFHGMMVVDFETSQGPIRIICTHLNPYSSELRTMESQIIAQSAMRSKESLIVGDFNCLAPGSSLDLACFKPTFQARVTTAEGKIDTRAVQNLIRQGYKDLWRQMHEPSEEPAQGSYPTPLGGKNQGYPHPVRIDHMLGSSLFAQSLKSCSILKSPELDTASDHYPLCAEFDL